MKLKTITPGGPRPGERILYYTGERNVGHISVGTVGHIDHGYAMDLSKYPSNCPYVTYTPPWPILFHTPLRTAVVRAMFGDDEAIRRTHEEARLYSELWRSAIYRIKEHRDAKSFIQSATRPLRDVIRQGL